MRIPILAVLLLLVSCSTPLAELDRRDALSEALAPAEAVVPRDARRATLVPPAAPQSRGPRAKNYLDFMFGASYWNELGGLDPTGVSPVPGRFGDFDRWGFAFDFGYDRVVQSTERTDWTVGLELGWSTFANSGSGLASPYSDISATMFYIAPTTRVLMHLTPTVTLTPGIGAGYYAFFIDEYETYYYSWWWGYNTRTLNQDGTFGGFVSLAMDFHVSPTSAIRIDNKLHFASFSGLESLMPNETSVDGPIWTIEAGFVVKF